MKFFSKIRNYRNESTYRQRCQEVDERIFECGDAGKGQSRFP